MKRVKRENKKMMITLLCLNLLLGMTACGSKEGVDNDSEKFKSNFQGEELLETDAKVDDWRSESITESNEQSQLTYPKVSVDNKILGITIDAIDGMGAVEEYLVCNMNGVAYAIGSTDSELRRHAGFLYEKADWSYELYNSYSVSQGISGQEYIGDYLVEFMATDTELSSDTKTLTLHNITYLISLENLTGDSERSVVLNLTSENIDKLELAKSVAKEIIGSIRKIDKEIIEETVEDDYLPKEYVFPIDVYFTDKSTGYDDTVMLISWVNMTDKPGELIVIGPEGQRGVLNEEYSYGGHYLYEFGKTGGGEYYIHGGTDTQLIDSYIMVSSMEGYLEYYHYYEIHDEVPDYILNRPAEDEDF